MGLEFRRVLFRSENVEHSHSHDESEECCGAHEVCEKTSLLNSKNHIEYYDDEDLDVFAGRSSETYSDDEITIFEDVFYSMQTDDVPGWVKSLQLRQIELPESIRDQVLLIVRENRFGV